MSANIFYAKFSELSGERYDANTYHKERLEAIKKLESSTFELKKLKYLTLFNKNIVTTNEDELPYIGLVNIESNTGIYLQTSEKETFSSAVAFKKGQVLFPKLRPYLNKVYFAEFDGLCSTEFHIFDSSIINNRFLAIFLQSDLVVSQTKHLMSGNTLPRLQTEDIENLLIPIPVRDIQNKIILKIEQAYKQKEQKEKEAQNKLESIDAYLLNELGIKSFSNEKESLEDRVFFRKFSELSGNRLDSDYKRKIDYLDNLSWKYQLIQLKDLMIGSAQYGANETAKEQMSQNNIRYIRITDIDAIGNLKKDNWKTVEKIEEQYFLNYNDILFARSGSVGKCYIHKEIDKKSIFAGYLIRFVLNEQKINPDYFFFYCNSSVYKYWVSAIERPAVQSNINSEEFKSLTIPLPPIEIQNKTANHIQNLRDEAQALKDEAIQIFEDTKKELEKSILGGF